MHTLYKCEVFARDYTFRSFAPIESPEIQFDYLTLEKTSIKAVKIDAKKGDFVSVSDQNGKVVYQGIVDDVNYDKSGVSISAQPLLSVFDADVYFQRSQSSKIEQFIAGIITDNFVSSDDNLQNISGLSVTTTTETSGALNLKDNIHNLYEIITKALTAYGIVVSVSLDPQKKTLITTVGKVQTDAVVEADLKSVIEKNIIVGDSYGQLNKVVIYNKADETQKVTYYLHPDGKIDTEDTERITPVFFANQFLETDGDFATEAYQKAYDALSPQKYDNMIEITVRNDCSVIDAYMEIGTEATVLDGDKSYGTILTGIARTNETTKLTFGVVRADLTKILILERRSTT